MNVTMEQIRCVPWIDHSRIGGRTLTMMPMFDGERWNDWIFTTDGRSVEIHPLDVAMGSYLARSEAKNGDLYFPFLHAIWQHFNYPNVAKAAFSVAEDMRNLSTSLAKVDFFWIHREELGLGVSEFVRTEVEYVLVVARSILDHLHEIFVGVWSHIQLTDEASQKNKKQKALPKKMSRTCIVNEKNVVSAAELNAKFALPLPIAQAYEKVGTHLLAIRRMRDGIVHHGKSHGPIFVVERGFGIGRHDPLGRAVGDIWREQHFFNENVVSLRPLLAHLAVETLYACSAVTDAISQCIELPPPIAPGLSVFMRAEHFGALVDAQAVLKGGDGWWMPIVSTQE